ncbi:MAG TPA: hypothetical protein VFY37_13335, partial [Solirubrobacterales bacterium]|nr:hypothetical protein [Solirubrobacterales bacterium]
DRTRLGALDVDLSEQPVGPGVKEALGVHGEAPFVASAILGAAACAAPSLGPSVAPTRSIPTPNGVTVCTVLASGTASSLSSRICLPFSASL